MATDRGSRLEIVEFKESVVVRHDRAGVFEGNAFENDGSARDGVAVYIIGYSAGNMSCLRFGWVDVLAASRPAAASRRRLAAKRKVASALLRVRHRSRSVFDSPQASTRQTSAIWVSFKSVLAPNSVIEMRRDPNVGSLRLTAPQLLSETTLVNPLDSTGYWILVQFGFCASSFLPLAPG